MSVKINKNGNEYDLGFVPQHYPADRVYLDGDTSKTVQGEIDEISAEVFKGSVSAVSSNDTFKSLLNKLRNLIDYSKVTANSKLIYGSSIFNPTEVASSRLIYTNILAFSTTEITSFFINKNGDCHVYDWSNGTYSDISSTEVSDGKTIRLYY